MKTSFLREVTLYRFRYVISYGLFAALLFLLLLFGVNDVPRGLSEGEMQSAVSSVSINILKPEPSNVIDAPYHLLQKASIQLLGLSPLSLKLPTIILGVITGLAMVVMLQRWFRRNVAVITAIIMSTSVGFISMARLGEPLIMPTFWTVILLLASTFVLHGHRVAFLWKAVCFASVGMLLYSPLGIYPLIAMAIAGLLHPHVRHRLKRGKWWQFLAIAAIFAVVVTPLGIAIAKDPDVGLRLLGLTSLSLNTEQLYGALREVMTTLFNYAPSEVSSLTVPLFSLTTLVLLLLGFFKLGTASYSARSYMLFIWILLLIPVLLFNPQAVLMVITPAILVLAIGVETLIREWYGLFPRNPYARIGALLPLTILIGSIVVSNVEHYFYGNHYSNVGIARFHPELPAVKKALARKDINQTNIRVVVPESQVPFYDILRREFPKLNISAHPQSASEKGTQIVTDASGGTISGAQPYRIITGDLKENSVLLRIYTQW